MIAIDAVKGTLEVELSEEELRRRGSAWKSRENEFGSGYLWKYAQTVGSAKGGAVTHPGGAQEKQCYADI
jgi:dihydroxy-acid dehydratase